MYQFITLAYVTGAIMLFHAIYHAIKSESDGEFNLERQEKMHIFFGLSWICIAVATLTLIFWIF